MHRYEKNLTYLLFLKLVLADIQEDSKSFEKSKTHLSKLLMDYFYFFYNMCCKIYLFLFVKWKWI